MLIFSSRYHKQSLVRLDKLIDQSTKRSRHRRNLLNIHITVLSWIVEFCGFLLFMFGAFITGVHRPYITAFLKHSRHCLYFIILPSIWLTNDAGYQITESRWYLSILNTVGLDYSGVEVFDEGEEKSQEIEENNEGDDIQNLPNKDGQNVENQVGNVTDTDEGNGLEVHTIQEIDRNKNDGIRKLMNKDDQHVDNRTKDDVIDIEEDASNFN